MFEANFIPIAGVIVTRLLIALTLPVREVTLDTSTETPAEKMSANGIGSEAPIAYESPEVSANNEAERPLMLSSKVLS